MSSAKQHRINSLAALLSAVALLATTVWAGEAETRKTKEGWERVETVQPEFAADGQLTVVNVNGEIIAVPSKDGVLRMTTRKVVRPKRSHWPSLRSSESNERAALEALDQLALAFSGDAKKLAAVSGKLPERSRFQGSVHYAIELPEAAFASLSTVNGQVRVTGAANGITVTSTNGKIVLEDISGDVTAQTTNGSIRLERVAGPVSAHTVNGGIDVHGRLESLEAASTNGSITCRFEGALPPEAAIECRTSNGGITLSAPSESAFALHASTSNGRIRSDFPLAVTGAVNAKKVEGVAGKGGADITLRTTNGSITLNHG